MPQETNLNVIPYNDDFDPKYNYYRVLFKPTNPVQVRELNNLQSILQDQIEKFGNHIFKEGSVVIPGTLDYDNNLSAIELQNSYNGLDVSTYLPLLEGKVIRGKTSGIRAVVSISLVKSLSIRNNATLYVKYISPGNSSSGLFSDNEELVLEASSVETLATGETVVFTAGETIAITISSNCNSVASSVSISEGVFFVRGTFVNVYKQILLLEQYSNTPTARVGLDIDEKIVTAYDNSALFDNASGFSNYTAPGADRFAINLTLTAYQTTETPNNFVQLLELNNGVILERKEDPQYNLLEDELARRTYDESGDYYVTPPSVSINESLNNLLGNNGIFNSSDLTYDGNSPNESLGVYKVSPITAFVQGYEVKTEQKFIDFPKPRTTKLLENQSLIYYTGSTLTLNRVYGSPIVGISSNYVLSLRDSRVGVSQLAPSGKEIGLARVYDFALESGSYTTSNLNLNEWDISLFDVQPYTEITLNQNLDNNILYNVPCQILGKSSGATGYLRYDSRNSGIVTAYDIKGSFAIGEKLSFNGIDNTRVAIAVTSYATNNVKSVYGVVGTAFTFTADVKQFPSYRYNQVNITAADSTGISTVTQTTDTFTGNVFVGDLVAFTTPGISTVNYARVTKVLPTSLTITGVTTVTGICEGKLPATNINPSDFTVLTTKLADSQNNTLYTAVGKQKISNVNLTNSSLTVRKQFDVQISSNSIGPILADTNETFLPFDEERYVLIREDGTTEVLTSDKFVFSNGGASLTINGLGSSSKAKLIATLKRIKIKEKVKYKNRVNQIVIDKSKYVASGIGTTTLNDGLTYGNYPFGTRVQDDSICLLAPDVTKLYGIFESSSTSSASLPKLVLSSLSGPTNKTKDLLIGEKLIGSNSNAVAILVGNVNDLSINFVYLNAFRFAANETIKFQETGITANIVSTDSGDLNITSHFTLDIGQRDSIYDYARIIRKQNTKEPTRKLTIVFESASYLTSDSGDIVTVNSYSNFDYCDLPMVNDISVTDIVDVRPIVSNYTVAENSRSPFEFLGRDFSTVYSNPKNVLASDESINLDYSFYLPRIDKLFLTKYGNLQLASGAPAETPQPPNSISNALEIGTAYLPAYLCDVNDADITLLSHKRYRMTDIKDLEDRISHLEYYTSLSLLETKTENLFIPDGSNLSLNRFKSGFFVDNFSGTLPQPKNIQFKNSVDIENNELGPSLYTSALDLVIASNSIIGIGTVANTQVDIRYVTDLIGSNTVKTGNLVTLNYSEVSEIIQPYSTRIDTVSTYRNNIYSGTMALTPASDIWPEQVTQQTANVASLNYVPSQQQNDLVGNDPQIGLNPILKNFVDAIWKGGDQILSINIVPYLRSRNIEFIARQLKPFTQVYPFFDGRAVDQFVVPKLIQITMISGTFQVGETVVGTNNATGASIKFRVATSNHKIGPYNNPTEIYTKNPYSSTNTIASIYSSTSTILNVDTYSLANLSQGLASGYIDSGMSLIGQTSKAQAIVNSGNIFVTDGLGDIIGSLFIPDSTKPQNPSFEAGTKIFRITNSSSNSTSDNDLVTFAEERFISIGRTFNILDNVRTSPSTLPSTQTQASPPAPAAASPQNQDNNPWQDGDIIIRGGKHNISDAEGTRLVESINSKNHTSFNLQQIKNAAGVKKLDSVAELQRMNAAAKRLAGK